MRKLNKSCYIRVAICPLEAVLPFVFTSAKRHKLKLQGYKYTDLKWINASKRTYPITTIYETKNYKSLQHVEVLMGSHRYQLFVLKGTDCVKCGIKGRFFALEQAIFNNTKKFHFNLYGVNKYGNEVMITKDHIIPRSKGGKNILDNYQPLCINCNQYKANKIEKC